MIRQGLVHIGYSTWWDLYVNPCSNSFYTKDTEVLRSGGITPLQLFWSQNYLDLVWGGVRGLQRGQNPNGVETSTIFLVTMIMELLFTSGCAFSFLRFAFPVRFRCRTPYARSTKKNESASLPQHNVVRQARIARATDLRGCLFTCTPCPSP